MGDRRARAAFFGHDACRQQIGRSRRLHDALGQLHANLLLGMNYGWWNDKHNRHHANPNHTDKDADVAAGSPDRASDATNRLTALRGGAAYLETAAGGSCVSRQ